MQPLSLTLILIRASQNLVNISEKKFQFPTSSKRDTIQSGHKITTHYMRLTKCDLDLALNKLEPALCTLSECG